MNSSTLAAMSPRSTWLSRDVSVFAWMREMRSIVSKVVFSD